MREKPTLDELTQTVDRMQARLSSASDPRAAGLVSALAALDRRFVADLADPRDLALARSAALMVARAILEDWGGRDDAG